MSRNAPLRQLRPPFPLVLYVTRPPGKPPLARTVARLHRCWVAAVARAQGYTYREIGGIMGISKGRAGQLVARHEWVWRVRLGPLDEVPFTVPAWGYICA